MPTDEMEEKTFDFTKTSGGSIHRGQFDGEPADALRHILLSRAGVTNDHALKRQLVVTRLGAQDPCDRLPSPFPPDGYDGTRLVTTQDWFDCIDSCVVTMAQQQAQASAQSSAPTLPPPMPVPPPIVTPPVDLAADQAPVDEPKTEG